MLYSGKIPISITCRLEALHLSPTELRIEDYYLVLTEKIRQSQKDRVREAIK